MNYVISCFEISGTAGRYAFISHSPRLRYATRNPPCVTRTLGQLFLRAGFGLAFQKRFPYLKKFNLEILRLREAGFIQALDRKWITGTCPDPMKGKKLMIQGIEIVSNGPLPAGGLGSRLPSKFSPDLPAP